MFWYLNDHLGSANVIMDESGQLVEHTLYYPFGAHREGGTEKYTFTGKELDSEIGLYYFEARYYNPQTFVFTQADSVIPNVYNPQSLNRYSYCYNNPVKYDDPDGHAPILVTAAAGAIVGGVIGGGGEFINQYRATGGSLFDLASISDFARSGDVDWRSVRAHTAGGAVAGGIAGLTIGVGTVAIAGCGLSGNLVGSGIILSHSGAFGNLAGGVAGRAVENVWNGGSDTFQYALNPEKMIGDIAGGAAGGMVGGAATKPIEAVITSPVGRAAASELITAPVTAFVSNSVSNAVNNGFSTVSNTVSNTVNNTVSTVNNTINKTVSTIKSIF
ncbi:MAG: RHS repeat-associated core domain-containing protein, partial [Methanimicrococcus sp.]|nr:RHS repeat-associated core domain-containing protein [Methanimicrococcus sp.]